MLGDLIYTVQIFDDENDTVTFNMTTEPSDAPFEINQSMYKKSKKRIELQCHFKTEMRSIKYVKINH